MKPCKACQDLIGKASTTPPHGDLAAAGVSFFGATTNPTQISTNWQCTVCGTWLYQCTSAGDPQASHPPIGRVGPEMTDL